jgi:hypothetical protein
MEVRHEIVAILEREPQLNDNGFGVYELGVRKLTNPEYAAKLARERARMLMPDALTQFETARVWLRRWKKTQKLNYRFTSYGLKHAAEREIGYISNGLFIAAAIAEGFDYCRKGPNARFNIQTAAIQILLPEYV